MLNGARTLWGIHPPAVRDEWRAYVENLALSNSLPGLHALGFVERVPSARLPGFLEQVRRDTSQDHVSVDFQVHPQTSKNERYVVEFVEPLDSNRPDLGYDISTEPNRREAAERARDSDKATLTHKITLVQEPQAAGVLLLLPVNRSASRPRMSLCGAPACWAGSMPHSPSKDLMGACAPSGR